ncbi:unnamed protein product [Caenorhabditis nigoni]
MKSLLLILLLFCLAYSELTEYQEECEDTVNRNRIITGMKEKIANMNELKYDEELEKAAKKEKHRCPYYEVQEVKENEMYSTLSASKMWYHPTATKVACIQYFCANVNSTEKLYIVDKGPGDVVRGELGSKCPSERPEGEGGLCELPSGSGVSKSILTVVLVVVLNFI